MFSEKKNKKIETDRKIKVRFPSYTGDESRVMTVQELQTEYDGYLVIDPRAGEQVDLRRLAELDINEVVVMPPIRGG